MGLSKTRLILYAIIWGFSQDDGSEFRGSWNWMAETAGVTTRMVAIALASLQRDGLISKRAIYENGVKYCAYRVISTEPKKKRTARKGDEIISGGDEIISRGVMKLFQGGDEIISPNDIDNNISDNIVCSTHTIFESKKPTILEVRNYCQERQNSVDADTFVAYYEASGWKRGRTEITDWRAAVRSWEKKARDQQGNNPPDIKTEQAKARQAARESDKRKAERYAAWKAEAKREVEARAKMKTINQIN